MSMCAHARLTHSLTHTHTHTLSLSLSLFYSYGLQSLKRTTGDGASFSMTSLKVWFGCIQQISDSLVEFVVCKIKTGKIVPVFIELRRRGSGGIDPRILLH
jgi:hypothetical protein